MPIKAFYATTIDDLLHEVYRELRTQGSPLSATRGDTTELTAVALELSNPLARLSRSEARGKIFSCLGELCWYLAGDDSLAMIQPYVPAYKREAVRGRVLGAYGPRLFRPPASHQVRTVIDLLQKRPHSRRAVLQLYDADDLRRHEGDIPCTCTLQFLVRNCAVEMIAHMRSNDAVKGLTHDIFCFTMLQELVARTLGLGMGRYCHFVGSLHLYADDYATVDRFLAEGFQSTKSHMTAMPDGDPWQFVKAFLEIEAGIRAGETIVDCTRERLPVYWQQLAMVLEYFHARSAGQRDRLELLRTKLSSTVFSSFVRAPA